MSDIEARLRRLGEKSRGDEGSATLPPRVARRVKRRRLATVATSLVVAGILAFGGAVAVGALEPPSDIAPADRTNEVLIDYQRTGGLAREEVGLTVRGDGSASLTIRDAGKPTTTEHELSDADLRGLQAALDAVDWPTAAAERRGGLATATAFELRHDGSVVMGWGRSGPPEVDALIDYLDALAGALAPSEAKVSCADRIDFIPTNLPEGWVDRLQPGRGSGLEAPEALGHYGNDADAGTRAKALAGFADLLEGRSPYRQTNRQEIEVLGAPASLGDIHEGYSVEFPHNSCDLTLVGYGVSRGDLARFAEGLRQDDPDSRSSDDGFAAIWPEDTSAEAEEPCAAAAEEDASPDNEGENIVSMRYDPASIVLHFGYEVLGWEDAIATDRSGQAGFADNRTVYELRRGPQGASPRAPVVIVDAIEVQDGCWSVASVSRPPDERPTGVGISLRGRDVEVGFDDLGADTVSFEIGHGAHTLTSQPTGRDGRITARLTYSPDDTGHFLILFKDEHGNVFSAAGAPLPAGDFVAG